jgi:hypothetical protein
MRDKSLRDFSGGWNTALADPGLDQKYSTRSENVMLHADGTYGVRWGTEYRGDTADQETTTGALVANSFSTLVGSAVVTVVHPNHGLLSGNTITFSGCGDLGGILAAEFNQEVDVNRIDANTYTFVAGTLATATASGQPAVSFSHDNRTVNSPVIATKWFQNRFVNVHESGILTEQAVDGICRIIFDAVIAGKLFGAPAGWSSGLKFASFTTFDGELLVFNGVDKPLIVNFSNFPPVTYLQDLATGSNFFIPITRYGVGMNDYVVLLGDVLNPDLVHISSVLTSGTYLGAPPPNDGVQVNLGKKVQSIANVIRGGGRFRDKLIVPFDDVTAIGTLGIYDGTAHEPSFDDAVDEYGGIAHRSMISLGDDFLMCDSVGVPSLSRTNISNTIKPERLSEAIENDLQNDLAALSEETKEDRVFAIYNRIEGQYMLFVPNSDDVATTTETKCYVLTYNRRRNVRAWTRFRGWNFRCGDRALNDRIFLFSGTKMYDLGNDAEPHTSDFENDPAGAVAITFDWELPWNDFGSDTRFKKTRYLKLVTQGSAQFDVNLYCDFITEDGSMNDAPQLTLPMVAGLPGFGTGPQPFGAGRRTNDQRAWPFTAKFVYGKLRVRGSVIEQLRFKSITFLYHIGSIRA